MFQVIAAEGEQKASRALREASDVITESAAALQLRYLQVFKTYTFYWGFLVLRSHPKMIPAEF